MIAAQLERFVEKRTLWRILLNNHLMRYFDILTFIILWPWAAVGKRNLDKKRLQRRREPHTHADVAVRPS